MVDARLLKGKTKVLTSIRSRETKTVNPKTQISANEYREIRRCCDQQKSRYEQGETSKDGATRPHATSQILLNKWQGETSMVSRRSDKKSEKKSAMPKE